MSNQIPERLINFTVYGEGNRIIGVADAKLPSIEMMTETVSGAGIAGELESGTLGHFKPMTVSLKWRNSYLCWYKIISILIASGRFSR